MTLFSYGPIKQMATDKPNVFAFRVAGHLDDDASEAMAEFMNDVFDREGKVNMLLDLTSFTGSDWDSMFNGDVIESQLRSLTHVKKYAVIGAPDNAAKMIAVMDKIIPVEAMAFAAGDAPSAWSFVGAQRIA